MKWRILDGPTQRPVNVHDQFRRFRVTVANVNDPAQTRIVEVEIAETVYNSDPKLTLPEICEAAETNGASAVARFLDNPPRKIIVANAAITPFYE